MHLVITSAVDCGIIATLAFFAGSRWWTEANANGLATFLVIALCIRFYGATRRAIENAKLMYVDAMHTNVRCTLALLESQQGDAERERVIEGLRRELADLNADEQSDLIPDALLVGMPRDVTLFVLDLAVLVALLHFFFA